MKVFSFSLDCVASKFWRKTNQRMSQFQFLFHILLSPYLLTDAKILPLITYENNENRSHRSTSEWQSRLSQNGILFVTFGFYIDYPRSKVIQCRGGTLPNILYTHDSTIWTLDTHVTPSDDNDDVLQWHNYRPQKKVNTYGVRTRVHFSTIFAHSVHGANAISSRTDLCSHNPVLYRCIFS